MHSNGIQNDQQFAYAVEISKNTRYAFKVTGIFLSPNQKDKISHKQNNKQDKADNKF